MLRNIILGGIFMFVQLVSIAQVKVKGNVVDAKDNAPLPGANVYLTNRWEVGGSTDINGDFELAVSSIDLKKDTLICSFIGYHDIKIPLSDWKERTIRLIAKTSQLAELRIEASTLVAEEYEYQSLRKIEIYTNPAAKADPLLAVNSLPSATPVDESANISLRGSSSLQTGVYFNDVPIYDYVKFSQLNGIGVFSVFNTALVKDVSVFPGNPPLEYGNTGSGLISVSSDESIPKKASQSVTISPGSIGYFRKQKIRKHIGFAGFVNFQPGGVLKKLNPASLQNILGFNLLDGGIHLFAPIGQYGVFKFFNYSLFETYKFAFNSPSFNGDFDQDRKRNFSTLKYEWKKDRHVLNFNASYSTSDASFNFSQFDTNVRGTDYYVGVNYQYVGPKLIWKTGISSDNRRQLIEGRVPEISFALGEEHPSLDFTAEPRYSVNESYLYGKYLISNWISLGIGVRSNLGIGRDFYLGRQLNLKLKLSDHWNVIVGGGRYFQTLLGRRQSVLFLQSDQLSMDFKWKSRQIKINLSLFWKKENVLSVDSEIAGIEIFVNEKIGGQMDISLSGSYLNAGIPFQLDGFEMTSISYYLRGSYSWNFHNTWNLSGNMLYREGANFQQVLNSEFDEQLQVFEPIFNEQPGQLPNYFTFGISLSNRFTLLKNFEAVGFASLNNVTNHRNIRTYTFDFRYENRQASLFASRVVYFGIVLQF